MEFELTQEMLDKIDQYIKGDLDDQQRLAFEQELKTNPPLREELLIQQQLFDTIGIKKIDTSDHLALSNKIKHIGKEYIQNPSLEKKSLWIRFKKFIPAAAAVLVIVVISTVYLTSDSSSIGQTYYDNINWETELPSFAEKGEDKNDFAEAETLFNAKEYTKAIQSFERINQDQELYPFSLMYIGASHANLDQDEEALQAFSKLAEMKEFTESSKGLWYAALIHLKLKEKEKALEVLNIIVKDSSNYHYKDALNIIKDLN